MSGPGPGLSVTAVSGTLLEVSIIVTGVVEETESGLTEFLELVEAENGLEALGVVEAHDDIRFAVVDIHMPIMNGIEFIRRFRSDHTSRFEGCHVFVITTEASRTLRAEMKELGGLALSYGSAARRRCSEPSRGALRVCIRLGGD